MKYELELFDTKCRVVGEGPLWDERRSTLFSVDFRGSVIRAKDMSDGSFRELPVPGVTSTVALCQNGELLCALDSALCFVHGDGTSETVKVPFKGRRFNDGKVGPDGCFYVGTKDANHEGALYRFSPDGSFTEILAHVGSSNGIDWSPDGKTLFLCDSADRTLYGFNFENGTVSGRRVVMTVPDGIGEFDGMCADSEGMLWCAVWDSSKVYRIDPEKHEVIDTVTLPVSKPTSCMFAGDRLDTLIITTASIRTDMAREPLAGQTFAVRPGVTGRIMNRFGAK